MIVKLARAEGQSEETIKKMDFVDAQESLMLVNELEAEELKIKVEVWKKLLGGK